jgi:hypothetical protein
VRFTVRARITLLGQLRARTGRRAPVASWCGDRLNRPSHRPTTGQDAMERIG